MHRLPIHNETLYAIAASFLLHPSRPNALRPVAKRGRAVGRGTEYSCPRISPPGKFTVWMLKYVCAFSRPFMRLHRRTGITRRNRGGFHGVVKRSARKIEVRGSVGPAV